jgi:hypothetical protein
LPLLRLDIGHYSAVWWVNPKNAPRRALKLAETVAPCVVWIDEMEKGLAHGGLDSGTSTRVFGTILTWMQEKTAPCFVVATANDIPVCRPNCCARAVLTMIFFLDLPTSEERREIFSVHLRKRKRLPEDYDLIVWPPLQMAMSVRKSNRPSLMRCISVLMTGSASLSLRTSWQPIKRQVPLSFLSARPSLGCGTGCERDAHIGFFFGN